MLDSSRTDLGGRIPASPQAVLLASTKQSPQAYLDSALNKRGYSAKCYTTTNSGYRNSPTPLQLASYHVHILKMVVLDKDPHALIDMLTCGISPNACNKFGESLIHRVCNFGEDKLLKIFLDCGADIQISDYAGRTPMHEVCRRPRPSFKTFELLVQQDARLIHMQDASGAAPLSFVRADQYGAWNEFLESILDTYWKPREASAGVQDPPPLALEKSDSRPVPDPENALSLQFAALVSGGRMEPDEAIAAHNPAKDGEDTTWDDTDDDWDDSEGGIDFDEKEFGELQALENFGSSHHNKAIEMEQCNRLPHPENAIPLEFTSPISYGIIEPDEAIAAYSAAEDDDEDSTWEDADDSDGNDSDNTSDDDVDFDERELEELQQVVNFGLSHPTKGMRLPKSDPENDLLPEVACPDSRGRIEPDEAIAAYKAAEDDEDSENGDDSDDDDSGDDSDVDIDCDEKEFEELQQVVDLGSSSSHTRERYFL